MPKLPLHKILPGDLHSEQHALDLPKLKRLLKPTAIDVASPISIKANAAITTDTSELIFAQSMPKDASTETNFSQSKLPNSHKYHLLLNSSPIW